MSIRTDINTLSPDQKRHIDRNLVLTLKQSFFDKRPPEKVPLFELINENKIEWIYMPVNYAFVNGIKGNDVEGTKGSEYPRISDELCKFEGKLRDNQVPVANEAAQSLRQTKGIFLELYCGFGKTFLTVYLLSLMRYKAAVIVHRQTLVEQWLNSFNTALPKCKVQIVKGTDTIDNTAQFYIFTIQTVKKHLRRELHPIGVLVVDEAHTAFTANYVSGLLMFTPKFTIGLSATPIRSDGMHKAMPHFFGPNIITKKLNHSHTMCIFQTKYVPEYKIGFDGYIVWDDVLAWQTQHNARNALIVRLVLYLKERTIMILCKRVEHSMTLLKLLQEFSNDTTTTVMVRNDKVYDKNARVFISTYSKTGVGFDHDKLDTLIVAGDVEEQFEQYHGRIFRRTDVVPLVIDIVDDLKQLKAHHTTRKSHVKKSGGIVVPFNELYPDFMKGDLGVEMEIE